jgi:hypothetical protein
VESKEENEISSESRIWRRRSRQDSVRRVISRSNPIKTMLMGVFFQPQPEHNFDGKTAMKRISRNLYIDPTYTTIELVTHIANITSSTAMPPKLFASVTLLRGSRINCLWLRHLDESAFSSWMKALECKMRCRGTNNNSSGGLERLTGWYNPKGN